MKRILSICISVIMLLGLMPQAFATGTSEEISATAETVIEAENHLSATIYSSATDTTGTSVTLNSENGLAKYYGSGEEKYKIAIDIPITVSQAGKYLIEYKGISMQGWLVSEAFISINGVKLVNNAVDSGYAIKSIQCIAELSAGSHTITVEGKNSTRAATLQYEWDYIKISPIATANVSSTGATRIEAENRGINQNESGVIYGATALITENASLSGGKGLSTGKYQLSSSSTQPYTIFDIPINVATEGYYNVKSNLEFIYDGTVSVSDYSLLLDGTSVETYTNEASASWAIRDTNVYLSAGSHTLSIKSMVLNRGYKHCSMGIDYVEIAPHAVDVLVNDTTKVEAEGYLNVTGVTNADPGEEGSFIAEVKTDSEHGAFSGEGYLAFMRQSNTYKKIAWELPVNVSQSGVYKITARVIKSNTYWGTTKAYIDGTEFGTGTNGSNPPEFESQTYTAILSEGNHTIKVENILNSMNAVVCIDYVEFEPVVSGSSDPDATATITPPTEVISGNEATLSYTYQGTNDEGNSIFRLMYKEGTEWKEQESKAVTAATATAENPAKITLPDALIGKEIAVQFIPVDATGKKGPMTEWKSEGVLRRAITITPDLTKSGGNFVASVNVEINAVSVGEKQVFMILAQYDENGAMINANQATVTASAPYDNEISFNLAVDVGSATEARLFVWSGTGYNDAGSSVYSTVTTLAN